MQLRRNATRRRDALGVLVPVEELRALPQEGDQEPPVAEGVHASQRLVERAGFEEEVRRRGMGLAERRGWRFGMVVMVVVGGRRRQREGDSLRGHWR